MGAKSGNSLEGVCWEPSRARTEGEGGLGKAEVVLDWGVDRAGALGGFDHGGDEFDEVTAGPTIRFEHLPRRWGRQSVQCMPFFTHAQFRHLPLPLHRQQDGIALTTHHLLFHVYCCATRVARVCLPLQC